MKDLFQEAEINNIYFLFPIEFMKHDAYFFFSPCWCTLLK